jgi:hypothetical protein
VPLGAGLTHLLQAPDIHAQQAMLVVLQSFSSRTPPVHPPAAQLRRPPPRRLRKRLSVHVFHLLFGASNPLKTWVSKSDERRADPVFPIL